MFQLAREHWGHTEKLEVRHGQALRMPPPTHHCHALDLREGIPLTSGNGPSPRRPAMGRGDDEDLRRESPTVVPWQGALMGTHPPPVPQGQAWKGQGMGQGPIRVSSALPAWGWHWPVAVPVPSERQPRDCFHGPLHCPAQPPLGHLLGPMCLADPCPGPLPRVVPAAGHSALVLCADDDLHWLSLLIVM